MTKSRSRKADRLALQIMLGAARALKLQGEHYQGPMLPCGHYYMIGCALQCAVGGPCSAAELCTGLQPLEVE